MSINLLLTSLDLLRKDYDDQCKLMLDFVDVFDEVIQSFDDAFMILPKILEEHKLPYDSIIAILQCYILITHNLESEENLTDDSFRNDQCWLNIRECADTAYQLIINSVSAE